MYHVCLFSTWNLLKEAVNLPKEKKVIFKTLSVSQKNTTEWCHLEKLEVTTSIIHRVVEMVGVGVKTKK